MAVLMSGHGGLRLVIEPRWIDHSAASLELVEVESAKWDFRVRTCDKAFIRYYLLFCRATFI